METSLRYRKNSLWMDGVSLRAIARAVGTPAYVYSARLVRERFLRFDRELRGCERLICYAMKANSNRALCGLLADLGAGAEVVSGGELRRALAAGFEARRVVFSGVGKTEEEIRRALRARILSIHLESAEEMARVAAVARGGRGPADISIRVNPGIEAGAHPHVATGRSGDKFGVPVTQAIEMYRRAFKDRRLRPVGIHCHLGSQITRVEPYARALRVISGILARIKTWGRRLDFVDLGGGMGIACGKNKIAGRRGTLLPRGARPGQELPLESLAENIREFARAWPRTKIILEPGRYLVADAGVLLTSVLYRKRMEGRTFAVVDAGMNDLARPALYGAAHPIAPASRPGRRRVALDVAGPVCESADVFGRRYRLPQPSPGEIWAILEAGAYGFSMSSQYNSRPRAAEILVEGGEFRVVRRRESWEDLVRLEKRYGEEK
ncbi:MAG: diaminopimelate decarboxylase [Elusimicrobia bacterium]|nr:diaminopimelate decarboxylase [Elusimicrobiota bacterium]